MIEIDSLPPEIQRHLHRDGHRPLVQGALVDVYMWSCNEALQFGRKPIHLTVLRLGWNPRATTPSFLDRFFKRSPEPERAARPGRYRCAGT